MHPQHPHDMPPGLSACTGQTIRSCIWDAMRARITHAHTHTRIRGNHKNTRHRSSLRRQSTHSVGRRAHRATLLTCVSGCRCAVEPTKERDNKQFRFLFANTEQDEIWRRKVTHASRNRSPPHANAWGSDRLWAQSLVSARGCCDPRVAEQPTTGGAELKRAQENESPYRLTKSFWQRRSKPV